MILFESTVITPEELSIIRHEVIRKLNSTNHPQHNFEYHHDEEKSLLGIGQEKFRRHHRHALPCEEGHEDDSMRTIMMRITSATSISRSGGSSSFLHQTSPTIERGSSLSSPCLRHGGHRRIPGMTTVDIENTNEIESSSSSSKDNDDNRNNIDQPRPLQLVRTGRARPSRIFCNHLVVNTEREQYKHGLHLAPYHRSLELDKLAHEQACYLAEHVQGLVPTPKLRLRAKLQSNVVAENIVRGADLLSMHIQCMEDLPSHRRHILSTRYNEMGMGTAKGPDGYLYLVQYFRYNPTWEDQQHKNQHNVFQKTATLSLPRKQARKICTIFHQVAKAA